MGKNERDLVAKIETDGKNVFIKMGKYTADFPLDSGHYESMVNGYLHDIRRVLFALAEEKNQR